MSTTAPPRYDRAHRDGAVTVPKAQFPTPAVYLAPETGKTGAIVAKYSWFAARVGMGFIFLWAFVDKLFGFGYATPAGKGWVDGGSPTKGFLSGSEGPFADFYHNLAGTTFANVTFMVGLAGIGIALLLGIGMRIAAASGALLMAMMYTVVLPPTTNPVIDDHLILAILLIGLAAVGAGNFLGLGRWWTSTPLVKRLPWLT